MAGDAAVVGAGPNGLAAAITLARAGRSVTVYEAADSVGGGVRSAELTLPGFLHDVCSTLYPLAIASPFFRRLPLVQHGLEWLHPPIALAHPLDDGSAVALYQSLAETARGLGVDADAYADLLHPLVEGWPQLSRSLLGPLLHFPKHPLALARFGFYALRSAHSMAYGRFRSDRTRALFGGMAAHAVMPLEAACSASFALMLAAMAHVQGWPLPRGGAQRLAEAMASYLRSLSGEIELGRRIGALAELPQAQAYLLDLAPRDVAKVAGDRLPDRYRERLRRFRHGPAAFKVDYALDGPVPWTAEECRRAGAVHVGGGFEEIALAERQACSGITPERPFVIVTQPSLFDDSRAPAGKHTLWAYCHVPNGSGIDMTERVEAQIERFAPGFRQRILARKVTSPVELEAYNPNYVGGDIAGGDNSSFGFALRPMLTLNPYATPADGVYICSASTPPGGGVHGMCGYLAARTALRRSLAPR